MVALSEVVVDLVAAQDENRFRALMQAHHYLGALPGIGETLRYVAHHRGQWLALVPVYRPLRLSIAAMDSSGSCRASAVMIADVSSSVA